jgi:hypothetical protein
MYHNNVLPAKVYRLLATSELNLTDYILRNHLHTWIAKWNCN